MVLLRLCVCLPLLFVVLNRYEQEDVVDLSYPREHLTSRLIDSSYCYTLTEMHLNGL